MLGQVYAEQLDLTLSEEDVTAPVLKAATKQQMLNCLEERWQHIGEQLEHKLASSKDWHSTEAASEVGVDELIWLSNDDEGEEVFDGFNPMDFEDPFEI